MRLLSILARLVPVPVLLLSVACATSPEALVAKHSKRGDEYLRQGKYQEAVIEYRNAVKAGPKDAALRWKLAQAAVKARDLRTAFPELEKTVELDPGNHEARGMLGEIYLLAGKTEEASRIADDLVRSRPQDPQGYLLQSAVSVRSRKVDRAIALLGKAVDLAPDRVRPMLTLGNLYMLKKDRKKALEWYDRAQKTDPESVEVLVTRGNYFFATGDREEGEREYRKAIEQSQEKETLRIVLAERFLYQGRLEQAEQELSKVIQEYNSQKARKVLAEIRLETGKAAAAKPIVEEILKENPKDLDGKYLKGRVAFSEGRFSDAKAQFGEVIRQDATLPRARLYNGLAEIRLGQIEAGRKEVSEAVRLDPDNVRARLVLGELQLKANAPLDAEKEAVEILQRDPSNVYAAILYGDSFLLRKDWKKAEQVYHSMVRQMPAFPLGYFKMGIAKGMQNRHADSARYFAEARSRNPKDAATLDAYVFALNASGQKEKAERTIQESLAKEPGNPRFWETRGRLARVSGKAGEAEKAFLEAIRLDPESPRPYFELGVMYTAQGKLAEAEARFLEVIEKEERNVGARTLLAVILNSQGRIEEANRQYRKALEIAPRNPIAANNLAANLSDHGGNLDEALKFAQIAREAAPEDPRIADTLGWIYLKKGLVDTAYPLLAEAGKELRDNPTVRYHLGMAMHRKGMKKEAAAELSAALAMRKDFPGSEEARKTLDSIR